MLQYSFNADLMLVLERLAASKPASAPQRGSVIELAPRSNVIPFPPAALQPRLEIAHIALRRYSNETHDAVT